MEKITIATIKECKRIFSKEYQNEHHPEREWTGDSWLSNMHLAYANDYISFNQFVENELEDQVCWLVAKDAMEYDWSRKIIEVLDELIYAEAVLHPTTTYDELGLELEKSHGF
jgi:hypothetical protein